jgi:hypothetical protein
VRDGVDGWIDEITQKWNPLWTTPNGQLQMDSYKWTIPNGRVAIVALQDKLIAYAAMAQCPFGVVHLKLSIWFCPFGLVHKGFCALSHHIRKLSH